jgi:hypothetical protein
MRRIWSAENVSPSIVIVILSIELDFLIVGR